MFSQIHDAFSYMWVSDCKLRFFFKVPVLDIQWEHFKTTFSVLCGAVTKNFVFLFCAKLDFREKRCFQCNSMKALCSGYQKVLTDFYLKFTTKVRDRKKFLFLIKNELFVFIFFIQIFLNFGV